MRETMSIVFFISAACLSCSEPSQEPCSLDEVFCQPVSEWDKLASSYDTARVLRLHRIEYEHYRPPLDVFLPILGSRGEDTVSHLSDALRNDPQKRDPLFYEPVLHSVISLGKYDFCRSQHYGKFREIMRDETGARPAAENLRALASLCAGKTTVPVQY